jgi:hypothetical protein
VRTERSDIRQGRDHHEGVTRHDNAIGTWAERLADEIMPLAKEAHGQLTSIDCEKDDPPAAESTLYLGPPTAW